MDYPDEDSDEEEESGHDQEDDEDENVEEEDEEDDEEQLEDYENNEPFPYHSISTKNMRNIRANTNNNSHKHSSNKYLDETDQKRDDSGSNLGKRNNRAKSLKNPVNCAMTATTTTLTTTPTSTKNIETTNNSTNDQHNGSNDDDDNDEKCDQVSSTVLRDFNLNEGEDNTCQIKNTNSNITSDKAMLNRKRKSDTYNDVESYNHNVEIKDDEPEMDEEKEEKLPLTNDDGSVHSGGTVPVETLNSELSSNNFKRFKCFWDQPNEFAITSTASCTSTNPSLPIENDVCSTKSTTISATPANTTGTGDNQTNNEC